MHKTIAILGRQPELGIAELECLYGADRLQPYGRGVCFIDLEHESIEFMRLGGSVRIAKLITKLPSTDWKDIESFLLDFTPKHASTVEGKLSFGISTFGCRATDKQISKTALLLKKAIKSSGKSVRMVPHKNKELGSAVVLHNKLHKNNNWELLVVSDGKTAYLAQTVRIQNIDEYSARDQERPMRDAKVGMLPPKLAQTIINLASGQYSDTSRTSRSKLTLLDPFCGTGVVLQEATIMGYSTYGTDIEPRMVEYTTKNLAWLNESRGYPKTNLKTDIIVV